MLASSVHSVETHSTSCTVSCFSWLTDESESRSHGNSHFSFLRSLPGKISDKGRPSAHHMSSNSLRFNIILGKRPSALINGENVSKKLQIWSFFSGRSCAVETRRAMCQFSGDSFVVRSTNFSHSCSATSVDYSFSSRAKTEHSFQDVVICFNSRSIETL